MSNGTEQALYKAGASNYTLNSPEVMAMAEALTSMMGARDIRALPPSYQNNIKVLAGSMKATLRLGSDDSAVFSRLHQGALSSGYGRMLAHQSGGAFSSHMGATLAASHMATRVMEGNMGQSLSAASGMSRGLIGTMLASMMQKGNMPAGALKQEGVKNLSDLRRQLDADKKAKDNEYTFSGEQRTHYQRVLRIADAMRERTEASKEYEQAKKDKKEGKISQSEFDAATKRYNSAEQKYKNTSKREGITDADVQEVQAINHGTLTVTKSRRDVAEMIKNQMHNAAGTLKELADLFGTDDFDSLQAYAKKMGAGALDTSNGIKNMRRVLNQASIDSEVYGMSKEQAIQNRLEISEGLAQVYGGQNNVPIEAVNRVHMAAMQAKQAEEHGYGGPGAERVTAREMASQANTIKHDGATAVAEEYVANNNDELSQQLQGLLDAKREALKAGDVNTSLDLGKMIKEVMYNGGVGFSEVDQERAIKNGYMDEYYDLNRTAGIQTHIDADMTRLRDSGMFDKMGQTLGVSSEEAESKTKKVFSGVLNAFGSNSEDVNKFIAMAEGAGSREEFKDALREKGVSEEELGDLTEAYDFMQTSEGASFIKRNLNRISNDVTRYGGYTGTVAKRKESQAFMDKLTADTNSSKGDFGFKSGNEFTQEVLRGVMGGKQLTDANYLQLAMGHPVDTASHFTLDRYGKLGSAQELEKFYDTNIEYLQSKGFKDREQFVKNWTGGNYEDFQKTFGLTGEVVKNEDGTSSVDAVTEGMSRLLGENKATKLTTDQYGKLTDDNELADFYAKNEEYLQGKGFASQEQFVKKWKNKSYRELQESFGLSGDVTRNDDGSYSVQAITEATRADVDKALDQKLIDQYGLNREELASLTQDSDYGKLDEEGNFIDARGRHLGDRSEWWQRRAGEDDEKFKKRVNDERKAQTGRIIESWSDFTEQGKDGKVKFKDKAVEQVARLYDAGDYERAEKLLSTLSKSNHWGQGSEEMAEKLKEHGRAGLKETLTARLNAERGPNGKPVSNQLVEHAFSKEGFKTKEEVNQVLEGMFGYDPKTGKGIEKDKNGNIVGGTIGVLGTVLKDDKRARALGEKYLSGQQLSQEEIAEITNAISAADPNSVPESQRAALQQMKMNATLMRTGAENADLSSMGFAHDGSGKAGIGEQQDIGAQIQKLLSKITELLDVLTQQTLNKK